MFRVWENDNTCITIEESTICTFIDHNKLFLVKVFIINTIIKIIEVLKVSTDIVMIDNVSVGAYLQVAYIPGIRIWCHNMLEFN